VIDEPQAVFAGDPLLQSLDLGRLELDHRPALEVDQVVVMLFGQGLIARAAVAEIVAGDDAGIVEQLQRAVNGRNRDARINQRGAAVQLLDIGMILRLLQDARHDPALLGHAHAAFGADFLKRFRQIVHRERTGG